MMTIDDCYLHGTLNTAVGAVNLEQVNYWLLKQQIQWYTSAMLLKHDSTEMENRGASAIGQTAFQCGLCAPGYIWLPFCSYYYYYY